MSFAIAGVQVDRKEAFGVILKALEDQYEQVCREGFDSTLEEWKEYSVTLHKDVLVKAPDKELIGYAKDLDRDGNLIIQLEDGREERIIAGDVSIRSTGGGY